MTVIEFKVNSRLELIDWNEELDKWATRAHEKLSGRPYHQVLPPLLSQDKDLVEGVVERGKPVALSSFPLCDSAGAMEAEVAIEPIEQGAEVRLEISKECRWATPNDPGNSASLLAHGVRNPLNAIKGAATYLKVRYAKEAELAEFTSIMEGEIARLENFISAYLSNSLGGCQRKVIDLDQLLRKIEPAARKQALSWEVAIGFTYETTIQVEANPFQLEQAILHLVNYAVGILPPGGEILLESKTSQADGQAPVTIVAKCGSRATGATDPSPAKEKGSGLFVAREIVQSHGGKLEIQSSPIEGTRIQLWLPAAG